MRWKGKKKTSAVAEVFIFAWIEDVLFFDSEVGEGVVAFAGGNANVKLVRDNGVAANELVSVNVDV